MTDFSVKLEKCGKDSPLTGQKQMCCNKKARPRGGTAAAILSPHNNEGGAGWGGHTQVIKGFTLSTWLSNSWLEFFFYGLELKQNCAYRSPKTLLLLLTFMGMLVREPEQIWAFKSLIAQPLTVRIGPHTTRYDFDSDIYLNDMLTYCRTCPSLVRCLRPFQPLLTNHFNS